METRNGVSYCRHLVRRLQLQARHLCYIHATLTLHFSRSIAASTDSEVGSIRWRLTSRTILFLIFVLHRATSSEVSRSSRGRPDLVRFPSWAAGRLTACPTPFGRARSRQTWRRWRPGFGVQGPRAGRTRLSLSPSTRRGYGGDTPGLSVPPCGREAAWGIGGRPRRHHRWPNAEPPSGTLTGRET
jgi:hypothetical protein